jgi:ATP-dependent phosphofructokinase / diphosphate-dependent phosphofructokinase
MRIGILTGGGDVPGLNPCIKAVVDRAESAGHEVIGLRRGWGALVDLDPDDPKSVNEHDAARPSRRADHRPDGRDGAPHLADEPVQGEGP